MDQLQLDGYSHWLGGLHCPVAAQYPSAVGDGLAIKSKGLLLIQRNPYLIKRKH